MRRLPRPTVTAADVIDQCCISIRDQDLSARLAQVGPAIGAAEAAYLTHAGQATLHTVQGTDGVAGCVSTGEMERVYDRTFVRSRRTRDIYDSLKKLPENDICPLCGQRTVSTLDHYLPKSEHPELAITPVNLVPACAECNHIKQAYEAGSAGDQTLHPYFDDADDARWLFARVQEGSPAALIFYAEPPAVWDQIKQQRLHTHFRTFELGRLYASHSAVELNNIRYGLQRMAERHLPATIGENLRETAESCAAAHPNSWQRATYEALADSLWYCAGGFNHQ